MRVVPIALAGVLAVLALPLPAACQEHATPPEAVELFTSAREHYREGRYAEAAADLERALILDPTSATLRYNLGRVYELLGQLEDARAQYSRYLELLPEDQGEERERTRATIARLEGAIASGAAHPPAAPEVEQEPLRELEGPVIVRERGVADEAFFITGGAGLAALVVSAITGAIALDRASARDALVLSEPGQLQAYFDQWDSLDGEAYRLGIATDVLIGLGAAALVAAVVLFFAREREVEREIVREQASIEPLVTATSSAAMIGIRGTL